MPGFDIAYKTEKAKQFIKIKEAKMNQKISDVCCGETAELSEFMKEVFCCGFTDCPDYEGLRNILNSLMV